MAQNVPELAGFRTSGLQTVGFVGNCNCNAFVRQRLDSFLLFHATAYCGLRVVAGVGTRFGRCVLERVAGMRWRMPKVRITALLTADEWTAYRKSVGFGHENALVRSVLQADEIVLLPQMDGVSESEARHRMLATVCSLIVEGYKHSDKALCESLDSAVAQAGGDVRVFALSGAFIRRITFAMSDMCRFCGQTPPGSMAEEQGFENEKEE